MKKKGDASYKCPVAINHRILCTGTRTCISMIRSRKTDFIPRKCYNDSQLYDQLLPTHTFNQHVESFLDSLQTTSDLFEPLRCNQFVRKPQA